GSSQLLANIHFEVRFRNQIKWHPDLPVCSIVKKHVVAVYTQQTTTEIALTVDRLPRLELCLAACKPLEIGAFVEPPFESRRRYFEGVGRVYKILDVENRPEVNADFRTILVGHTLRLINEYTNNRLVLGAGNLCVNQLKAMVDCDSLSQFLNPLCNRFVSHCSILRRFSPQKKKWARNPPDEPPCLRASCELYGNHTIQATWP